MTDANGKYVLEFSEGRHGAIPGPNMIRISTLRDPTPGEDGKAIPGSKETIPPKYNSETTLTFKLDQFFGARYPGWEICLFGHIGDGNLHVNVMKPDDLAPADFLARTGAADRGLFDLVRRHGGSISAEHGIGLLKKPYLGYSRSPEELELMRAIKRALDPLGILNPGKILDAS